ncbi:hypothetical protein T11_8901 [Trichinella zimbabwensis]|uniref:Uncharacterized protein n=1 Tax=Trichinella zimbabwensis TaxID=268475 RepID=A0A0V1HSQ1_9BILA|nr:hypothetical protein T11_8901 [Trichinella zimbabwensis]
MASKIGRCLSKYARLQSTHNTGMRIPRYLEEYATMSGADTFITLNTVLGYALALRGGGSALELTLHVLINVAWLRYL